MVLRRLMFFVLAVGLQSVPRLLRLADSPLASSLWKASCEMDDHGFWVLAFLVILHLPNLAPFAGSKIDVL